jgi:hypothetical protein
MLHPDSARTCACLTTLLVMLVVTLAGCAANDTRDDASGSDASGQVYDRSCRYPCPATPTITRPKTAVSATPRVKPKH